MIKVSDLAKEKASQLMKEEGFNPEQPPLFTPTLI